MTAASPAPVGYFGISAVSTYQNRGDFGSHNFKDLDLVPREAATARAAFIELGLTELCTAPDGEFTHDELYRQLSKRAAADSPYPAGHDLTVVLYCTGHGHATPEAGWRLVPPEPGNTPVGRWTTPADLLGAVLGRRDVSQVLLILDACFSGEGAREALTTALDVAVKIGSRTDQWVVAAARRLDTAQPMKFIPAFVDALRSQAELDLTAPYLDPSTVTDLAAATLRKQRVEQAPWVAAGYKAGGCRALPNPRFMPLEPPASGWIKPWWRGRGVAAASDPGWYFTGRDRVLRALATHLQDEHSPDLRPVLLSGGAGTGKSAILGRLLMTATPRLRHALPPVARRGYLPTGDVPFTVLDVAGLDVLSAVDELADTLGVEARDASGLIAALVQRDEQIALMVDDVDRAVDPDAMVEQLLRPLSAVPCVRLVATTRTGAIDGFRLIDVETPGDDSEPAIEAYVRARLTYALASQRGLESAQLGMATGKLVAACAGNFSAAVHAVDSLLHDLAAQHSTRDALDEAVRSAHRRLDGLCRETMYRCASGSGSEYVDDLVGCLSAACSYAPDGRLPTELWAAVAGRLNALPYTAGDVAAYGTAALAFFDVHTARDGSRLWRPRFGYVGRAKDPAPYPVVGALIDEARRIYGAQWTGCPTEVLAVLLGAAIHADGRFAQLLDEAPLLLAAPVPLVARSLKGIRDWPDGRARIATWAGVPVHAEPRERAFLVRLRAARNGLPLLASSAPDTGPSASPPVIWASRVRSPERPSSVTRLAVAAGEEGVLLVTAHDDSSVRWWDAGSGRELRAWPQPKTPWTDASILSIAAARTAHGLVTMVVTGDHQVYRWGPDDEESPRPLSGPATLSAAHASGFVALVHGSTVTILDGTSGAVDWRHTLPAEVLCADIAGAAEDPVLWLVDAGGRVWRCDLRPGTHRPSVVGLCPAPLMLACSRQDAAVVVADLHGRLVLPTYTHGLTRPESISGGLRSAAVTTDWRVFGGSEDQMSGWLDIRPVTAGLPVTRWPLDEVPIGLGAVGDRLIVATPDGLASIRLPTDTGDPPRGHE